MTQMVSPGQPTSELFGSEFLGRLEKLSLLSRRLAKGGLVAERRSRNLGASQEFADYRNYVRGDDLRRIDWNIYGRLEKLFVKLYESEEDLQVDVLVDCSASMRWAGFDPGSRQAAQAQSKLDYSRLLAAGLAYIALAKLDRVKVHFFARDLLSGSRRHHGKKSFQKVLHQLEQVPGEGGETDFNQTLATFSRRNPACDMCLVVSDFLVPQGPHEIFRRTLTRRAQLILLQVIHPLEWNPQLSGSMRLRDSETTRELDSRLGPGQVRRYREKMRQLSDDLATYSRRQGLTYVRAFTDVPFEELILRTMREQGVLR
jgi:uncharacterized protein (DUF58 family)